MHIPYQELFGRQPDFEVTYHIYSPEEGGRTLPGFQGTLWDFMDDVDRNGMYMIYPEILNLTTREPFERGMPIPENGIATMWILSSKLRSLHQQRIKVGTRGYFMEGSKKVAVCEVTNIISLFSNPVE
ncbi:hypothetical protein IC229_18075 [Spirosoma sp. BT702]|uniref:Uncharacterized protein n=1 Tax=Spirosoma profusum TaxID=2771354 RepID=A0A926Y429_9BACT|nr:hypothetical protein [Spirosoma profusum]MBD2702561.1 hypothetical protein [Spirosoma profusum]